MDHSSGLVLALSGKAIGCQGICAFHISLKTAFASPSRLTADFEDNIFKSLLAMLRGYFENRYLFHSLNFSFFLFRLCPTGRASLLVTGGESAQK